MEFEGLARLQTHTGHYHGRILVVLGAVLGILDNQPLRKQAGAQLLEPRLVPAKRIRLAHQPDGPLALQPDRLALPWGQLHRHNQVLVDVRELLTIGDDQALLTRLRPVPQQQIRADQDGDPNAPSKDKQPTHPVFPDYSSLRKISITGTSAAGCSTGNSKIRSWLPACSGTTLPPMCTWWSDMAVTFTSDASFNSWA